MTWYPHGLKSHVMCVFAVALAGSPIPALAQSTSMEGRIRAFECGDNCYLTIIDSRNKEHTGLCTAPECEPWNEQASMPSRYRGKRVSVTLGQGIQLDTEGTQMGRMTAFKKIRFLD